MLTLEQIEGVALVAVVAMTAQETARDVSRTYFTADQLGPSIKLLPYPEDFLAGLRRDLADIREWVDVAEAELDGVELGLEASL